MGEALGRGEVLLEKMPVDRMSEIFPEFAERSEPISFKPTRAEGLKRLEQFVARTGRHYTNMRNYDFGASRRSNVSVLSPWLRHRLITEAEVLQRVLARHSTNASEKFVQEVFWRTYFKGWLEQRPSVWTQYQRDLVDLVQVLGRDPALQTQVNIAVTGKTGIDCFDHWGRELIKTGYLHNHARMWFASIWIFTLRLPWQLGADFFLRHLLDGDPASNTLSWRWVGGLHTKNKIYLARADNIAKFTEGRFNPRELATSAEPLTEQVEHPRISLSVCETQPFSPYLLLLTEEDLSGAALMSSAPAAVIGLSATQGRSPNSLGRPAKEFAMGAMNDALAPFAQLAEPAEDWSIPLLNAAKAANVSTIATAYAPVGPVRSRLDRAEPVLNSAGITLHRVVRSSDAFAWPHAKAGFFSLKKKIPSILNQMKLAS
ncbi:FAD-binding domain-containing protein [Epibacterium ulvae]|uniref:FAD-binding domain-containing protein n=1 Tax=Epibacterium ulvae TaxID=1156985 RepID=UPI002491068A|nr:FAD-binding domain-containing protein [Epibacterium ulvae]